MVTMASSPISPAQYEPDFFDEYFSDPETSFTTAPSPSNFRKRPSTSDTIPIIQRRPSHSPPTSPHSPTRNPFFHIRRDLEPTRFEFNSFDRDLGETLDRLKELNNLIEDTREEVAVLDGESSQVSETLASLRESLTNSQLIFEKNLRGGRQDDSPLSSPPISPPTNPFQALRSLQTDMNAIMSEYQSMEHTLFHLANRQERSKSIISETLVNVDQYHSLLSEAQQTLLEISGTSSRRSSMTPSSHPLDSEIEKGTREARMKRLARDPPRLKEEEEELTRRSRSFAKRQRPHRRESVESNRLHLNLPPAPIPTVSVSTPTPSRRNSFIHHATTPRIVTPSIVAPRLCDCLAKRADEGKSLGLKLLVMEPSNAGVCVCGKEKPKAGGGLGDVIGGERGAGRVVQAVHAHTMSGRSRRKTVVEKDLRVSIKKDKQV